MNEMSDQVRGIIFVILVLLIIGVWSHFYTPAVPPNQKNPPTASQPAHSSQAVAAQPEPAMKGALAPSQAPAKIEAVEASAEKTIVVESTLYRVEISNRGGV